MSAPSSSRPERPDPSRDEVPADFQRLFTNLGRHRAARHQPATSDRSWPTDERRQDDATEEPPS